MNSLSADPVKCLSCLVAICVVACNPVHADELPTFKTLQQSIPILGVTPSKDVEFSLEDLVDAPQGVVANPTGDTYTLAPTVADNSSAYWMSSTGTFGTHTFDTTGESAGNNVFGSAGGYIAVFEEHLDQGGGIERIVVIVEARNSSNELEPWVDASNAGGGLITWQLDLGTNNGGTNPIDVGETFTLVDSGVSVFDSTGAPLAAPFDLALDTSSGTQVSGVAAVGLSGSDIAGFDMAGMAMFWDIQLGVDPGTPELEVDKVDAEDGTYTQGSNINVQVTIKNNGDGPSPQASFNIYASTDPVITSGDVLMDGFIIPPIPAGEESVGLAPTSIPNPLPDGGYYIGVIVNFEDDNLNNNNNFDPIQIEVTSDPDISVRPQSLSFSNAGGGAASGIESVLLDESTLAARRQATDAVLPGLLARTGSGESVRIIAGFDLPVKSAGSMGIAEAQQQQAQIAAARSQVLDVLQGLNFRQNRQFRHLPFVALTVDDETLRRLAASPLVASIEEDRIEKPTLASSNIVIGSPLAWAEGYDGSGQVVAVLDTGVDKTHPFFSIDSKVVSEACYSSNDTNITSLCPGGVESSTAANSGLDCSPAIDGCDHGTHVAGIVAGNDGVGPNYGVARGADIIAIQVFSQFSDAGDCAPDPAPCVRTFASDQIAALERVLALKDTFSIAAANMSLGGGQFFSTCDGANAARKAAIDNLRSVGIATVIAAGNDGYTDSIGAPACISTAVSVGATTDQDFVAAFSNVYAALSLMAPGVDIDSSVQGPGIGSLQGTSMAAPHVAGAWAVMKHADPSATVTEVLNDLQSTAEPVDDNRAGGSFFDLPRINLDMALNDSISRTTFGIFNPSPVPLNVTTITPENPASWITVTPNAGIVVPPRGLQVVQVAINYGLAPEGETVTRLLINSDDPDESPWPDGVNITVNKAAVVEEVIFLDGFENEP